MPRTTLQLISPLGAGEVYARNDRARYATQLGKALISTAPPRCEVRYADPAHPLAWAVGMHRGPRSGLVHSFGLAAPLTSHDRQLDRFQVTVTVHEALAWTHPASLSPTQLLLTRTLARRAARYADAIVVPTHAVADVLTRKLRLGDRLRVIPPATAGSLVVPKNIAERVERLRIPDNYLLAPGSLEPRAASRELLVALAHSGQRELNLVLLCATPAIGTKLQVLAMSAGLAENRVRVLSQLSDADLAVVMQGATALALPSRGESFGMLLVEAFAFGVPVLHSDTPTLVELAAGAGVTISGNTTSSRLHRGDASPGSTKTWSATGSASVGLGRFNSLYADRLAAGINTIASDKKLAAKLSLAGRDRAKVFSWEDSARALWQLHAEL